MWEKTLLNFCQSFTDKLMTLLRNLSHCSRLPAALHLTASSSCYFLFHDFLAKIFNCSAEKNVEKKTLCLSLLYVSLMTNCNQQYECWETHNLHTLTWCRESGLWKWSWYQWDKVFAGLCIVFPLGRGNLTPANGAATNKNLLAQIHSVEKKNVALI